MDIALYSIRLVRPFSDEEVEKLLQFGRAHQDIVKINR